MSIGVTVVYALNTVNSGDTLSSAQWNEIVAHINAESSDDCTIYTNPTGGDSRLHYSLSNWVYNDYSVDSFCRTKEGNSAISIRYTYAGDSGSGSYLSSPNSTTWSTVNGTLIDKVVCCVF